MKALIPAALAALLTAFAAGPVLSQPAPYEPRRGQEGKDAEWLPTPDDVVEKMLDLAQVAPGERLVDLGSGDGKIAIAAAKRGAIARGIEYNAELVEHSRRKAREAGVSVQFIRGDIFKSDFSDADVVTLYLTPYLNERLRPTLLAMKPGTRVVSNYVDMGEWKPDFTATETTRDAHLWRVPANVAGEWTVRIGNNPGPRLRIEQRFQKFGGEARWGDRAGPLRDTVVRGPVVAFTAADATGELHRFEGVTDHRGPITGVVTPVRGGAARLFVATRRP